MARTGAQPPAGPQHGTVGRTVGTPPRWAGLLPQLPVWAHRSFLNSAVGFLQLGLCQALQGGRTEGRLGARPLQHPLPFSRALTSAHLTPPSSPRPTLLSQGNGLVSSPARKLPENPDATLRAAAWARGHSRTPQVVSVATLAWTEARIQSPHFRCSLPWPKGKSCQTHRPRWVPCSHHQLGLCSCTPSCVFCHGCS